VKVAFDTSVIVAGAVAGHRLRERARPWLAAAQEGRLETLVTSHALAEVWATLTALPISPRLAPAMVERVVERFARHTTPVDLTWEDYSAAIRRCGDRGLRSGAVYDALHLVAAERHRAEVLLTFDTRHFVRLAGEGSPRILAPPDPPGLGV